MKPTSKYALQRAAIEGAEPGTMVCLSTAAWSQLTEQERDRLRLMARNRNLTLQLRTDIPD